MPTNWYVIQTQFKQESIAQDNLERQGFEVFYPQYIKIIKEKPITLPLFSGYIFVSFDIHNCRWQSIHSTVGVSRILGYSATTNMISPCRDDVIPSLRAFSDSAGVIDMAKAFPAPDRAQACDYKQGEVVKILSGMFENQEATYWNSTKNGAMVILSLLNRPVRVILRHEEIAR